MPKGISRSRELLESAVALHRAGKLDEAAQKYRAVLAVDRDQPDALSLLGQLVYRNGNVAEALNLMTRAQALRPESPTIVFNLARLYFELRDWPSAVDLNQEAARLAPSNPAPLCNLGVALVYRGCYIEGEAALRKSIALSPDSAAAWSGLGLALARQDRRDEARAAFEKALGFDPSLAEAKFNLAEILLGDMDFERGWPLFAARAQSDPASFRTGGIMPCDIPQWRGEGLAGKTVLVWGEQGLGDQILFASLIPDLLRCTGRVVVACAPRLATLFARSFPDATVLAQSEDVAVRVARLAPDFVVAAGSLAQFLRAERKSFANQRPFIVADSERTEVLRKKYRDWSGGLPVIGVSWRSSRQDIGAAKSVPIDQWASMLRGIQATWVSLQYGDAADERARAAVLGVPLHDDPGIDPSLDLADQANQIAAMDMVVSVSNTTVHVAAGLGKPVWTLAPLGAGRMWYWFAPDTPWASSPWYPSMRVFHQRIPGDWSVPIERVRHELISIYGG